MSIIRKPFRRLIMLLLIMMILLPLLFWKQTKPVSATQTIVDSENPDLIWWPSISDWGIWNSDTAYGGSVRFTTYPGATVSYTFYGTSITYLYTMAFNRGAVKVYIDGEDPITTVDKLNGHVDDRNDDQVRIPRRQTAKTYSGLSPGYHTITIEANPGEDGNRIYTDLDAFIINPDAASADTYDDTTSFATVFKQSNWYTWNCVDCYNGSYKYTTTEGAGVRFTFIGNSITWYFTKANNRGMAGVTIDGENKNYYYGYFDLYSPLTIRNQAQTFNGLGGGVHTITIYNIHQKNPLSIGYLIDIDKFIVGASISYIRTKASNYADARAHDYDFMNCPYYFGGYGCSIDGYDCMNFSSQTMHVGGFPYNPSPPGHNWITEWYYDASIDDSSLTWKNVPDFMTYQSGRSNDFLRTTSLTTLRRGDLVPLDLLDQWGYPGHDNVADHMRVIVGAGLSIPFGEDYVDPNTIYNPIFEMLIDQHFIDRWQVPYNYNTGPGDVLDFIHIIKY